MTTRMVRLTQPEPYRAAGVNTSPARAVTLTLRPRQRPARINRKVVTR